MSELVAIYDTTLRDGMQREGLSLSVGEQLAVAVRLAEYGIDYIEAGFPASNPKYGELFRLLRRTGFDVVTYERFADVPEMNLDHGCPAARGSSISSAAEATCPSVPSGPPQLI